MSITRSSIGQSTSIWKPVNIYDARIGIECSIGAFTEIGGAIIGDYVRIQAHCFIPMGVRIADGCFIGPRVTFTNVKKPDPCNPTDDYEFTIVRSGVTIGAGAVILPGIVLGRDCFIAAGAVVVADVGPGTMVAGNPARYIGPSPNKE